VPEQAIEALLRDSSPRLVSVLLRRYGSLDVCEDAAQEALLAAATAWPREGLPANPMGWLVTTASRRLVERWRSDTARRRREQRYTLDTASDESPTSEDGDTLPLLFLCCHPTLTAKSQVTLTLRAVGGLTTAEIAGALLVPESTVGQRISRAKARIKAAGAEFREPSEAEREERLPAVLETLYLIFTEGHTASSGTTVNRVELSGEAIRLTRQLYARLPHEGEVAGLLALMLLTDARRPARTDADGDLVPLAEQDRRLWDAAAIAEGTQILSDALASAVLGKFQLQAAIAAVHDEATTAAETDWRQILALYDVHTALAPGSMVTLNRIVAVAAEHGATRALAELTEAAARDPALADHYRVDVVRAHLLELLGDFEAASLHYQRAARLTRSLPEQRYLRRRARPRQPHAQDDHRPR
jgi:RNA polymerase sigma factor (sigma-70 family)